tara:strand:+ start:32 stop:790 length:759 start_codon:yes stop_codon:yes gene_type:complete
MNYKNLIFIVIFLFITNCASNNLIKNKKNTLLLDNFSNTGFALIFDQKDYDNDLISHKIDERSLVIFQKNLRKNTKVKITNLLNNKSLIANVGKSSNYPVFNNSVISIRIANELALSIDEPYIQIIEISENSMFVAKKAKTFDEEKNVAKKAPVKSIDINDLNKNKIKNKKKKNKNFSYEIKIADFFFNDTASLMVNRIINETKVKKPKIKKISKEKYRVYLGPFNDIISLQKSYNDVSILQFDNIEITRND